MLPRDRAEKILTLHAAGWSVQGIADQLGHSLPTIRDYINGRRTPGIRAPRPSLLTDLLANYCRQRLSEDPNLRPATLFTEVTELGFKGSRTTFYRELTQRQLASSAPQHPETQEDSPLDLAVRPLVHAPKRAWVLPRRVAPISGETLASYLNRLAHANHLALAEVLTVLPSWFSTKINNRDDRAQHHMLTPATAEALNALAHLTSSAPADLAHALPAFGTASAHGPIRATTACHRCTARHGIDQPAPVHLPAHQKVCTRHRIWLSDPDEPQLDLTACPEITAAQHHANRLLRRHTPQQLMLAFQAASKSIPPWPNSPTAIQTHWKYRLLALQTANHRLGTPTDLDSHTRAAIYPDAINGAAQLLNRSQPTIGDQT